MLLTLLLGFLTVQSGLKASEIFKKENIKIKAKKKLVKEARASGRKILEGDNLVDSDVMQVQRRSIKVKRGEEMEIEDSSEVPDNIRIQNSSLANTITMNKVVNNTTTMPLTQISISPPKDSESDENEGNPYSDATPAEIARLDKLLAKEQTHY